MNARVLFIRSAWSLVLAGSVMIIAWRGGHGHFLPNPADWAAIAIRFLVGVPLAILGALGVRGRFDK